MNKKEITMRGIIDELKEIRTYNDIQLFNRVTDSIIGTSVIAIILCVYTIFKG